MRNVTVWLVDAFTQTPGKGNRAGVVFDAEGLTPQQMQSIAATVNVSETAFHFAPDASDHDLYIRYFTPLSEVPVCGHATIASHYLRAEQKKVAPQKRCRMKTGVGILEVDTEFPLIVMTQKHPTVVPIASSNVSALCAALGLAKEELDTTLQPSIVGTGSAKMIIPIRTRAALHALKPNLQQLAKVSEPIGPFGTYVMTRDSEEGIDFHGRMFWPGVGINEDPVTGNANGPAGAFLFLNGIRPNTSPTLYYGKQGEAMGKPGIVEVRVFHEQDAITKVQIAGKATVAGSMQIEI